LPLGIIFQHGFVIVDVALTLGQLKPFGLEFHHPLAVIVHAVGDLLLLDCVLESDCRQPVATHKFIGIIIR